MAGEAKWPAQINDSKAAVRFIKANADKYDLDATNIVLWGNSAGGHLAEMLAATNGNKEMEDISMGNPNISSDIQGVVSLYGVSDVATPTDLGTDPANQLMGYNVKDNPEKANAITGKNQAQVKIYIGASHGDAAIKTVENVAENLNFVDKIMYPDGKNPYRSNHYEEIKTISGEK